MLLVSACLIHNANPTTSPNTAAIHQDARIQQTLMDTKQTTEPTQLPANAAQTVAPNQTGAHASVAMDNTTQTAPGNIGTNTDPEVAGPTEDTVVETNPDLIFSPIEGNDSEHIFHRSVIKRGFNHSFLGPDIREMHVVRHEFFLNTEL
jgi:hypothetical protein